jgi:hypothetical protein
MQKACLVLPVTFGGRSLSGVGSAAENNFAFYCLEGDKITFLLLTFAAGVIYYAEYHTDITD